MIACCLWLLTQSFFAQETNPDNFESWENLIKACEALDGGLNRNSSPQALSTIRDAYDRLLLKFPLFFGYWKKYADLEFNIAGPESAEMVRLESLCFRPFLQGSCGRDTLLTGLDTGL